MSLLGEKAIGSISDHVSGLTDKLEGVASGNPVAKAAVGSAKSAAKGESSTMGAVKGIGSAIKDKIPGLGGDSGGSGSGGGSKATKATTIIEEIDVGVPVRVAYNQWTEFGGFPTFMKKVENVDASEDTKLEWKAQIVWSHRTWEATILEQVPEERIVWRSKGNKGHVDGSVTFHELGPNLTRILVVLEYYPKGLFERTGNIWRAQGRRARVELKHFKRHVMTRTILDPDSVEGWRGTIEDSEVVESHEDAVEREEQERQDEGGDEYEGEEPEDEYEDESEEGEPEDESEEGEPEDEYEDEGESEEGEPEDEYEEGEESEEGEEPEDEGEGPEDEGESEEGEPEDEYEEPEGEAEEGEPEDEYEEEGEAEEGEEPDEAEPEAEYEEADEGEEPEDAEEAEPEDEYEEEADEAEPEDEPEAEPEDERPARSRRKRAS